MTNIGRNANTFADFAFQGDANRALEYVLSGSDRLDGSAWKDRLLGFAGDDVLNGAGGNDRLYGGSGNDWLLGGTGNDLLDGGIGSDSMKGSIGNDTYVVDSTGDRVVERLGEGVDLVRSTISYALPGNVENLTLAAIGNIGGTGNSGSNVLRGNGGSNALNGGAGNDSLMAGAGNDRLIGGIGKDLLGGGSGADVFQFRTAAEAGKGSARDIIRDFQSGVDRIHLAGIDANAALAGNQAFEFIGSSVFSGAAGELAYRNGIVAGDVNGDKIADFAIGIENLAPLLESDFLL